MDRLTDITDAVRASVKLMVDNPKDAIVECSPTEGGASLRITVARADLGKIIGQQGRTARSLRVLASAMGMAAKLRINLDIQD
ncbi:KH domain-containing protein [Granulicella sp. L46]|uniref:KH domain-containing protein n=1 Tax=Granulicella sp. L46 TaxID=1641865 RepID=UPI00131E4AA6|nr:KH domain-containing protein [Granulicella sp. L46]